jgi:hypothetical protein
MSEPLEQRVDAPAPEAPVAAEPSTDPNLQHATERLERLTARPAATQTPAAEAPAEEPAEEPATAPARPATAIQPPRSRAEWQARQEEKDRRIQAEADARARERLLDFLEKQTSTAAPAEEIEAGEEDPEPDFDDDTKGWIAWRGRQDRRELMETISPVLEVVRKQGETQAQFVERQRQTQQEEQAFQGLMGELGAAHEMYASTPEGEGCGERLAWYGGHPGDPARGMPAEDGIIARGLMSQGVPPQKAREINSGFIHALADWSLRNGFNPAAVIDGVVMETLSLRGVQEEPQPQPVAPVQSAARPAQREVAAMRQTAAGAAGVAGSLARSASRRQPPADPVAAAVKDMGPDRMARVRKAIAAKYPNTAAGREEGMRHLRRIAESFKEEAI